MSKTILHLDMNSYFATCEQQASPALRNRPVGIIKATGRGCIIAASVEAKRYGVTTGCTVWQAKKLCPQIILVPSDMAKYFAITRQLVALLTNYSPTMEIFSIDEMFLDITQTMRLFPGGYLEMVLDIKRRLRGEIGDFLKCSVGISFTKLLAKLASEMHKPDGFTLLTQDNYLTATAQLPVEEVCGIGYARAAYLKHRGAYTLEQARALPDLPSEIRALVWLQVDEPLASVEDLHPAKSVSRTFTTFATVHESEVILKLVRNLIEEATAKLREMVMKGRTCTLFLDSFWARKTLAYPTDDPQVIYALLEKEYLRCPITGIRQAGVSIHNLLPAGQLTLLNQREDLLKAVDRVNSKFGLFTVYPAHLLGGELVRPEVTGYLGDKYYRFGRGQAVNGFGI